MTPPGGWRRALLVGAAVVLVAAVAVLANLTLLDAAGEDRLGRLNQGDPTLIGATAARTATAPPRRPARTATTDRARTAIAPPTASTETDEDDHSGRGSGDDSDDDPSGRGRGRGRGSDDD